MILVSTLGGYWNEYGNFLSRSKLLSHLGLTFGE